MKPIRTTGPLPFEHLSYERFEDLCVQVVFNLKPWINIQHYGRKGKDGGVDIFGEFIEEDTKRSWVIQCKRYRSISFKLLKDILNDFKSKNDSIPNHYVLFLACDVSRDVFEKFQEYARSIGFPSTNIMTASILEAELYARHPDILYTFFGIQSINRRTATVGKIRHRISPKKKAERELIPRLNTGASEVIIHDIHRDIYPNQEYNSPGISPWFRLEFFRPYHRGLSFYSGVVEVHVDTKTNKWKLADSKTELKDGWIRINAFRISNIPYDNIVDFDSSGDEYYNVPHFFCEFNNLGSPYEETWYRPTDEDKDKVFTLAEGDQVK